MYGDNYMAHYGVLGMKWGRRRGQTSVSKAEGAVAKAKAREERHAARNTPEAAARRKEIGRKVVKGLLLGAAGAAAVGGLLLGGQALAGPISMGHSVVAKALNDMFPVVSTISGGRKPGPGSPFFESHLMSPIRQPSSVLNPDGSTSIYRSNGQVTNISRILNR